MPLTAAQKAALKSDIAANVNTVPFGGVPTAINALPNSADANFEIAKWYSAAASPEVYGWDRAVSIEAILNGLNYPNFTPNDAPNQTTEVAGQTWENRAMLVQIKQINLQLMLQGRTTFDATRTNNRAGLQDATENLPTGNNGNNRAGGWLVIQPALSRAARRVEVVLRNAGAGGSGTKATPYTFDYEGAINFEDVEEARNFAG